MTERAEQRGHYDSDASVERYAAMRRDGLFDHEAEAVEEFFDPAGRVLDLGCGAGRTTVDLVDRGYDVVALDRSGPMVASTRAALPDVPVVVGDAASLPFPDDSFSTVLFSYNGIDELRPESARLAALRESRRVLEPGGVIALSTRNRLRWLVPFPPTRRVIRKLLRFWQVNLLGGNVGDPYKHDVHSHSPKRPYFSGPRRQRRQLRRAGFRPVARPARSGPLSSLFGPNVFFVAETAPTGCQQPVNEYESRP